MSLAPLPAQTARDAAANSSRLTARRCSSTRSATCLSTSRPSSSADNVIQRIGGEGTQNVDFRLIAATNRDLRNLVSNETFRLDFYYRISPIVLTLPPLRERLDDIPALVEKFLTEFASRHQLPIPEIEDDVYGFLTRQEWPGNIRQLRHEVARAVIFCKNNRLSVSDFQPSAFLPTGPAAAPITVKAEEMQLGNLQGTLDRVESDLIRKALVRCKGNKKKVAEELGISRSYLYKKLGVALPN
jgi:transcriptional regulator with PAS, ATPase and Fis domain